MPRDLFGDVTRPSISIGNRKWYTVPVSLLSHSAVVFAVIVIPLLATDVLPEPWEKIHFDFPMTPPPPPPPPPIRRDPIPTDLPPDPNAAPHVIPDGIAPERPIEPGFEGDRPTGIVFGDPDPSVVLAPPEAPPPVPVKPVQVGGVIRRPQKVHDAQPVYHPLAIQARVQGIVIIEATIGPDGAVIDARVLRSVMPLLDEAAVAAVRQWQYTPTLLNGVPVPVIMTVTVQFTLQ